MKSTVVYTQLQRQEQLIGQPKLISCDLLLIIIGRIFE